MKLCNLTLKKEKKGRMLNLTEYQKCRPCLTGEFVSVNSNFVDSFCITISKILTTYNRKQPLTITVVRGCFPFTDIVKGKHFYSQNKK